MLPATHYAYPEFPNLEVVMRLQAVKRWHMIEATRTQTLAEHTANVALLAWLIAHTSPGVLFSAPTILLNAMVHDLAESFLGDIPTHSKPLIGKEAIKAAEDQVLPQVFALQIARPGSPEHRLLKLCDLADGIRFIRVHGVDITARHAQQGLEKQLELRLTEAAAEWPDAAFRHVYKNIYFYAYEQAPGERPPGSRRVADARSMEDDVARKSRGGTGGP
jgi:5'-deoxynucleotidase YfbR-like HD superfamily hydrolase